MSDKNNSPGEDLPLGLSAITKDQLEQDRSRMRQLFCTARAPHGQCFGFPVEEMNETDKALAFNFLWERLEEVEG